MEKNSMRTLLFGICLLIVGGIAVSRSTDDLVDAKLTQDDGKKTPPALPPGVRVRIGFASTDITPDPSQPLMGYSELRRTGRASSRMATRRRRLLASIFACCRTR
jgi:hypothetical protein